jgi:hypothetical protein
MCQSTTVAPKETFYWTVGLDIGQNRQVKGAQGNDLRPPLSTEHLTSLKWVIVWGVIVDGEKGRSH